MNSKDKPVPNFPFGITSSSESLKELNSKPSSSNKNVSQGFQFSLSDSKIMFETMNTFWNNTNSDSKNKSEPKFTFGNNTDSDRNNKSDSKFTFGNNTNSDSNNKSESKFTFGNNTNSESKNIFETVNTFGNNTNSDRKNKSEPKFTFGNNTNKGSKNMFETINTFGINTNSDANSKSTLEKIDNSCEDVAKDPPKFVPFITIETINGISKTVRYNSITLDQNSKSYEQLRLEYMSSKKSPESKSDSGLTATESSSKINNDFHLDFNKSLKNYNIFNVNKNIRGQTKPPKFPFFSYSFRTLVPKEIQDFHKFEVDEDGVNMKINKLKYIMNKKMVIENEIAWLLRVITCIDLTTLGGDDTDSNVKRLVYKAAHPISINILDELQGELDFPNLKKITTAAVCVYPAKVSTAFEELLNMKINTKSAKNIQVASVATGFPSGQYPLETRLKEIAYCVASGATEIDVVIRRELVIKGKWEELFNEITKMKSSCGSNCQLKTILATGECGTLTNVYKASLVAMYAGSDFIKTSTGKESVNATLPVGVVMCRAIKYFYIKTGRKVGLKPAGGIRTYSDALNWLILVKEILGNEWLNSKLFRIGASGLLGDVEKRLFYLVKGYQPESSAIYCP